MVSVRNDLVKGTRRHDATPAHHELLFLIPM